MKLKNIKLIRKNGSETNSQVLVLKLSPLSLSIEDIKKYLDSKKIFYTDAPELKGVIVYLSTKEAWLNKIFQMFDIDENASNDKIFYSLLPFDLSYCKNIEKEDEVFFCGAKKIQETFFDPFQDKKVEIEKINKKNLTFDALKIINKYCFFHDTKAFFVTNFYIYDRETKQLVRDNWRNSWGWESMGEFVCEKMHEAFPKYKNEDLTKDVLNSAVAKNIAHMIFSMYSKKYFVRPEIINFKNGFFDCITGKFVTQTPEDKLQPSLISFNFDYSHIKFDDLTPNLKKFIEIITSMFYKNKYGLSFLHSLINPNVKNNVGFWFYGDKGIGKSTFFEKLFSLFGSYIRVGDFNSFGNESKKKAQYGSLIVMDTDASKGNLQFTSADLPKLKKELNGERILIDVKFKDASELVPTWTWVCLANDVLKTTDLSNGDGTLDRVVHIKLDKATLNKYDWTKIDFTKEEQQIFILFCLSIISDKPSVDYRRVFIEMDNIYGNQKYFVRSNSRISQFTNDLLSNKYYLILSQPNPAINYLYDCLVNERWGDITYELYAQIFSFLYSRENLSLSNIVELIKASFNDYKINIDDPLAIASVAKLKERK